MRRAAFLALAVLAAGCGGSPTAERAAAPMTTTPRTDLLGTPFVKRTVAPDFALRDQHGRLVRLSAQRGRYVLVTFLYTHCPDVCPLIASNLNTALRQLGPRRSRVSVLAVSVDPKGDTPAAVRAYARRLRLVPQFHYLTGTRSELLPIWSKYNVLAVARKADLVDHVAYTVLLDPSGRRRVLYDAQAKARSVAHDLRVLMNEKQPA